MSQYFPSSRRENEGCREVPFGAATSFNVTLTLNSCEGFVNGQEHRFVMQLSGASVMCDDHNYAGIIYLLFIMGTLV